MRERHSNSRIALRAPASGGWLRQSLTSNSSRASLRHANNDGLRLNLLVRTRKTNSLLRTNNQPFVRPSPTFAIAMGGDRFYADGALCQTDPH
jgi:hypothetical protein